MPLDTTIISQNLAAQQAMMGNQMSYAAQIGSMHGTGGQMMMPTYAAPPPAQPGPGMGPNLAGAAQSLMGGISTLSTATPYTNQASMASSQITQGMLGLVASPQTPLAGQMFQGLQEQQMVNTALSQSFNFMGSHGRGFSVAQRGQIGQFMGATADRDIFASLPELTNIMQGGVEMGAFQGVRDVQQFKQRFNSMLSSLKEISRTLGTTLEEAQQFTREMQQIGVFSPTQQIQTAQQISGLAATSGIGMQQLMQFGGQTGNIMNRALGADRATSAQAGVRMLAGIGTASQQGIINEQQVWNATGQTGLAGRQALAGSLMQANAKFLRRGAGNITLAAFIDPDTGEINQERLGMFMSGQIRRDEVASMASSNISQMGGAAEWQANRGMYRAKFMEATQGLGPLALMMGVMPEGIKDDPVKSKLWLKRRTGMSSEELDVFMPQIENYDRIMKQQEFDTDAQKRQQQYRQWAEERGPAAMQERLKQKMEQFTTGPFKNFAKNLQGAIDREIEAMVDEQYGVYTEYLSSQSAERFTDQMRAGRMTGTTREFLSAGRGLQGGTLEMPTSMTVGERFGMAANDIMRGYKRGGLGGGAQALTSFISNTAPDMVAQGAGIGLRWAQNQAAKLGLMSPAGSMTPMDARVYSGTADWQDLKMNQGDYVSVMNDPNTDSIIQNAFTGEGASWADNAAADLARANKGMTKEQARGIVYRRMKESSELRGMSEKTGVKLPFMDITIDTSNAEASKKSADAAFKAASQRVLKSEGDWKTLRSTFQDTELRSAMAAALDSEGNIEDKDAFANFKTELARVTGKEFSRYDLSSKENRQVLYAAMALDELSQSQEYAQRAMNSYGALENVDTAGMSEKAADFVGTLKDKYETIMEGGGGLETLGEAEGAIWDLIASAKSPGELRALTEELRTSGLGPLADDIEKRDKNTRRLKKMGQRGRRVETFKTVMGDTINQMGLSAKAKRRLMQKVAKGTISEAELRGYASKMDLDPAQRKQFDKRMAVLYGGEEAALEGGAGLFQELGGDPAKITDDELDVVARQKDTLGDDVPTGGRAKGGALDSDSYTKGVNRIVAAIKGDGEVKDSSE